MTGDMGTMQRAADEDRIDAAGWWQLGGLAVLGAVLPIGFVLLRAERPAPWTAALVIAVALVVVLPMAQVFAWARRGGRAAVVATRRWVRAGSVPADVPEDVWRPRLQRYEDDLDRRRFSAWAGMLLTVLWGVLALTGPPWHWILALLWATIAVDAFVRTRRDGPVVRRLLASPAG